MSYLFGRRKGVLLSNQCLCQRNVLLFGFSASRFSLKNAFVLVLSYLFIAPYFSPTLFVPPPPAFISAPGPNLTYPPLKCYNTRTHHSANNTSLMFLQLLCLQSESDKSSSRRVRCPPPPSPTLPVCCFNNSLLLGTGPR